MARKGSPVKKNAYDQNRFSTRSKPGSARVMVSLSTQKAMRKKPGHPNPLPGTVSMSSSCKAWTNSTSSAMGLFGKR